MKQVTVDIYDGCYEVRVYPFQNADASDLELASAGYVRVLFERRQEPRIYANISLGLLSIEDVLTLQKALITVTEVVLAAR